jgi:hypothetical protein
MPSLAAHGLLQGYPFSSLDSFVPSSFHDDITIRPTATHSEPWMETPTPCPFPTPSLSIEPFIPESSAPVSICADFDLNLLEMQEQRDEPRFQAVISTVRDQDSSDEGSEALFSTGSLQCIPEATVPFSDGTDAAA